MGNFLYRGEEAVMTEQEDPIEIAKRLGLPVEATMTADEMGAKSAQIPHDTAYELIPPWTGENPSKARRFTIKLERVLLGLVVILALVLAYARWTEQDRVSQLDQALTWVVEVQKAQIGVLKATRDSLVANDMQLLEMMRFHSRYHAEQDRKPLIQPEGD